VEERPIFRPNFHAGFVVDKVALEQVVLRVPQFSLSIYVSDIILSLSVCACEVGGVSMDVNNSSRH
jgi:hypothetical protein